MKGIIKEKVVEIVCNEFGVTPNMLKQRSRQDPLPTVRAFIAHYLYRECGMFPREILPYTGHPIENRTVMYYYLGRKTLVERLSPFDKAMRRRMESINTKLSCLRHGPEAREIVELQGN